ncbi:MAG: hypothetical protein JO210_14595 [Acidobacteriaceae bacterium]|nr:hypothetical protein [Acidobacteriaceae bacterium]
MGGSRFVTIFGISLVASLVAAERNLTFDDEWDRYTLTFDDSKISQTALRQLAWLSPHMPPDMPSPYDSATSDINGVIDKVFTARPLERCSAEDPAYRDCSSNQLDSRTFFHNAEVNIAKSETQLRRLQHLQVPAELARVKEYLTDKLERYLLIEKARSAYYKNWNVSVLLYTTKSICGNDADLTILRQLSGQPRRVQYRLVQHDWSNQMSSCISKNGTYPVQSWKTFLSVYKIKENLRMKRVD